jgi:hypothetical protein
MLLQLASESIPDFHGVLVPNMQRMTVAQYRTRSDADGHLEIIHRLMPNAEFVVMFNPDLPQPQPTKTHPRTSGR